MTERDAAARHDARETPPGMAGTLLRAARESAGMSIDAVAQHLKLAPRQVKAIENGDYTLLPGRTFIRGFVRNYARLVHLDPERVLSALPAGASAPALEAPTLQPTAPTIGELPTTDHSKTPLARWAIPLVLAAIVAVAAVYEWMRPAGETHTAVQKEALAPATPTPAPQAPAAAGTSLPNPLASGAPPEVAASPASDSSNAAAPIISGAPAPASATEPRAPAAIVPGGTAAAAEETVIVAFRDSSWTEIRDRDGRVLLSGMHPGGTSETVSGAPPLSIKIGNAVDVTLRYKGAPVDLAPYTQKNVARLTLP